MFFIRLFLLVMMYLLLNLHIITISNNYESVYFTFSFPVFVFAKYSRTVFWVTNYLGIRSF